MERESGKEKHEIKKEILNYIIGQIRQTRKPWHELIPWNAKAGAIIVECQLSLGA